MRLNESVIKKHGRLAAIVPNTNGIVMVCIREIEPGAHSCKWTYGVDRYELAEDDGSYTYIDSYSVDHFDNVTDIVDEFPEFENYTWQAMDVFTIV